MSCLVLHAGFRLSYFLSLWCFVDTAGYSQVCSISFSHRFMCILWAWSCFGRMWSCAKKSCSCLSSCMPFFLYLWCLKKGNAVSVARKSCPNCFVEWWLVCTFTTVKWSSVSTVCPRLLTCQLLTLLLREVEPVCGDLLEVCKWNQLPWKLHLSADCLAKTPDIFSSLLSHVGSHQSSGIPLVPCGTDPQCPPSASTALRLQWVQGQG